MDLGVIVLAICGISALCLVGIGMLLFLFVRTTGGDLLDPLRDIFSSSNDDELDYSKVKRKRNLPTRATLREKRSRDSFDAAVQRYQNSDDKEKRKGSGELPAPDRLGSANRFEDGKRFENKLEHRRRRRRNDDTYTLYDDDEDAFVEF